MDKYIDYVSKKDNYTFNKSKILQYKAIDLNLDSDFKKIFPEFTLLLESAITIEIHIQTKKKGAISIYWLLCWEIAGSIYEIICEPPSEEEFFQAKTYKQFTKKLGGILEFYHDKEDINENDFYWLNKTKILCMSKEDSE